MGIQGSDLVRILVVVELCGGAVHEIRKTLHGQERPVVGLLDAADEPFLVTHLHDRASSDFG